jgi:hypothetical protein
MHRKMQRGGSGRSAGNGTSVVGNRRGTGVPPKGGNYTPPCSTHPSRRRTLARCVGGGATRPDRAIPRDARARSSPPRRSRRSARTKSPLPRSRRACPLKPPNHPPRASSGKRNKFAGQSGNPTAAAGRRVGHDSPMRCQRRTTTSVVASSRPYTRDARGRRVCGTAADGVRCFIQNRVGALLLQLFHPCRVTVRTRRRSINPKSTRRSARRGAHHLGWRINIEISPKQALSYVHNSYFAFL